MPIALRKLLGALRMGIYGELQKLLAIKGYYDFENNKGDGLKHVSYCQMLCMSPKLHSA